MGFQVGVDPIGIGRECPPGFFRQLGQACLGEPVDAKRAHHSIDADRWRPHHLRQPARAKPSHEIHLEQPILGMDETESVIGVIG